MLNSPPFALPANRLEKVAAELHKVQADIAASKAAFYAERDRAQREFAQVQNALERKGQALLHERARLKYGPSSIDGS